MRGLRMDVEVERYTCETGQTPVRTQKTGLENALLGLSSKWNLLSALDIPLDMQLVVQSQTVAALNRLLW